MHETEDDVWCDVGDYYLLETSLMHGALMPNSKLRDLHMLKLSSRDNSARGPKRHDKPPQRSLINVDSQAWLRQRHTHSTVRTQTKRVPAFENLVT
jgi:hypothetical protein